MNNAVCLPVVALALLAGLLAAAGPAPEIEAPRPAPALADDIEAALDEMVRDVAREEGRIDPDQLRQMIAEAQGPGDSETDRQAISE